MGDQVTDRELYPGRKVRSVAQHRKGQIGTVEGLAGHRVLVRWRDGRLSSVLLAALDLVHEDDEDTPADSRVWEDEA